VTKVARFEVSKPLTPDTIGHNEPQDTGNVDRDNTTTQTKPKKGRKAGSRKTRCEFKLTLTRTPSNKWDVTVLNGTHNHEPSLNPSTHPTHRKLTQDKVKLVKSMSDRAAKPWDILLAMRQLDLETHVTTANIQNQKAKLRKEELGGRTATEALLELLMNSSDWATSWVKDPNTNGLNRLLFCNHKCPGILSFWGRQTQIVCQ